MKIKKIREEEPGKPMREVLGKAYGMARARFDIPKLERKLRGKRI